jgi:chromosome segregation ATPase
MKHLKTNLGLLAASVAAVSVLAVGPVSAAKGSGSDDLTQGTSTSTSTSGSTEVETHSSGSTSGSGSGSGTSSSSSTTVTTNKSGGSGSSHESETKTETEHGVTVSEASTTGDVSTLRGEAKQLLETERQNKKQHSVEDRQKACTTREADLNKKITNYGTQATRQLTRLNDTYAKLQAYQADKKLSAADYAALAAAADGQKTTATAAVDALTSLTVKIDCSSTDPAASVATVKSAVKNARTALQDYRKSIKAVLVSLMTAKSASGATDSSATGTADTTTGGTN